MNFPALVPRSLGEVGRILFIFIIAYCLLLIASISPILAQTNQPPPTNTHNYVQTVMLDTMAALTCNLAGIDPTGPDPVTGEPKKCLGYDPVTGALSFVGQSPAPTGGGAIGAMGNFIAVLYNPPLSSGEYVRYLAGNFGLVKPVYAQGTGFEGLKPLMAVWTVFRNLVYVLFAVAFILVGLAIMLRVRIDPRTVMTIQNQIPKLIIALLLVTFSYAIAGFLVDVMYVTIYLLFGVVKTANIPGVTVGPELYRFQGISAVEYANNLSVRAVDITGNGVLGITANVAGGVKDFLVNTIFAGPIGNVLAGIIGAMVGIGVGGAAHSATSAAGTAGGAAAGLGICAASIFGNIALPVCAAIGSLVGTVIVSAGTALVAGSVGKDFIIGSVASLVAFLIIGIAVLWSLFRLWFALITAYVMLLIDVVFAPFWVLVGVLPGSPIGFGAWLRSILSNLSVYPVTIGMFLLAKIFMDNFQLMIRQDKVPFMPPLIGNPGTNTYGALSSFIGLGFILLTPQVVAMVKDFLKAPVFKYMPAIGQAIGVGPAVAGGLTTAVASPLGALAMFGRFQTEVLKGKGPGEIVGGIAEQIRQRAVGFGPQKTEG